MNLKPSECVCVYVPYVQHVHILLPLVFDDNEGSNDDNDINYMQPDDTVIMLFTGWIMTTTVAVV